MAGPEEQQQAHAAEIRALTEGRRTDARSSGEPMTRSEVQAMVDAAVAKAVKGQKVTIQNANDIIVTGQFPNFTIGRQPTTITGTANCNDDGTISITLNY